MDFRFTPAQLRVIERVELALANEDTQAEWRKYHADRGYFPHALYRKVADAGLLRLGLPEAFGGEPCTVPERLALLEHISQWDLPIIFYVVLNTQYHIMSMLAEYGTKELQQNFLPQMMAGKIIAAMGVSEPDAGSDAANITTSAKDAGDVYSVSGSKIWNFSHLADYLLTSVKTNPEAGKREGLSVMMIDLKSAGVDIQAIPMLGERRNQVFLDDVKVPKANILGIEHDGWKAVTSTLGAGRYYSGEMGSAIWLMGHLINYIRTAKKDGRPMREDPAVRTKLAELYAEVQAVRYLYYRAGWMYEHGKSTITEGSAIKIMSSELKVRLSGFCLDAIGYLGQLEWTADTEATVPVSGKLIDLYRSLRPLNMIGGASNEIHRNILATRSLGLKFKRQG